jgi:hypothetical protein
MVVRVFEIEVIDWEWEEELPDVFTIPYYITIFIYSHKAQPPYFLN